MSRRYKLNFMYTKKDYWTVLPDDIVTQKDAAGNVTAEFIMYPGAQTFRNEIAARALQGLLSNSGEIKTVRRRGNGTMKIVIDFTPKTFVRFAFEIADEFIKQSNENL